MNPESRKLLPLLAPQRVGAIATATFTQLVRMKVFYFLAIFGLIVILLNFLRLPHHVGPESVGAEELRLWKGGTIGVMKLFGVVFPLVATALLIPRDLEDRTLYTILCKPVPRLDYLVGKLFGVLLLTLVALVVMNIILCAILYYRTDLVLAERLAQAQKLGWTQDDILAEKAEILRHGVTSSLQFGLWSIFLEGAVIAAIALLISTFSSSTIFTIVVSVMVYFIGHFLGMGSEFYLNELHLEKYGFIKLIWHFLTLIFPNFRLFSLSDPAIAGQTIPALLILKTTVLAFLSIGFYTTVSWFIFAGKEF